MITGTPRPERDEETRERQRQVKLHRPLEHVEAQDRAEDAEAVAPGAELADRAGGAVAIGGVDLAERRAQLERVNGELGLDLKALRQRREGFDVTPRHGAIARQHVGKTIAEDAGDGAGQRPVAELVAGAIGGFARRGAAADDHVETFGEQPVDHGAGRGGIVGAVAVGHQIDVGLDVGEHAPDDIALAAVLDQHDGRAGLAGDIAGTVGRGIVEDVDRGFGQSGAKPGDDAGDGRRFVVAGEDDGDAVAARLVHVANAKS